MPKVNGTIEANGLSIRATLSSDGNDYISLTDIAKYHNSERAADVIKNWMRLYNTVEYLGLWEKLHNPDFKVVEFDHFRASAGKNSFVLPPQQWIEATHAIGMVSKSGRYGGTYAHSDIAFKFAAWLSPAFELYIIKDYQRLKQVESDHLSLDWSARREIAKTNYKIHTDAIKEHLIRSDLPARYVNLTYANEADVINVALFGMTAKEWRDRTLMLTLLLVQPPSNAIFDEEKYPICDLHHLPLIIAAKKKIIICLNDECPLSRIPIMPVYFSFQNFIPEHIQ